jgi:elongation factor 2
MPKYNQDDVRRTMNDLDKVRNVCLIGAMGHGKTTVMDNFGAKTGFVAEAKIGDTQYMHYRNDEKERKCSIKANCCHMVMETTYQVKEGEAGKEKLGEKKKDTFAFSLLDCPGHVEFSPEVAAAQRMCDGMLVTVDVTSGLSVAAEYQIGDGLMERNKPCLFVNCVDKSILILERDLEDLYNDMSKVVISANVALVKAEKLGFKDWGLDPTLGNVVFGSAYYGWGFTLAQFAAIYAKKMGAEEDKFAKRLWGDQFFNAKKKSWTTVEVEGSVRGCCQMVLDPIVKMHKAIMGGDTEKYEKMCKSLGVELKPEFKKLEGKPLLKAIMGSWLPLSDALTNMVATHIPNPKAAQVYRTLPLYKGEEDSPEFAAMKACDKEGPLMLNVTKLMPTGQAGRFYAVGRIFSGTVKTEKYFVRSADYDPEDETTTAYSQEARVQSIGLGIGATFGAVADVPAGNVVLMGGIDTAIVKTATVTSRKQANNFANLKFNISPVLSIAIRPDDNKQLPKLVEGIKRLLKSDMLVTYRADESGSHIIGAGGGEHIRTLLSDLRHEHAGVPFTQGVPTVSYKETVTATSSKNALSKSANKHNRMFVDATPLEEDLIGAIEENRIHPTQDIKKRARIMIDEFGWDKTDCMKIWGFGPVGIDVGGANIIVDQTKGIQYLNEIKEAVKSGLQLASANGPLAEENMRGIRFNLMDAKLHADSIHRGMGQIQPCARRVFYAATLLAEPRFMEPFYKAVIASPPDVAQGVSQALMAKRGVVEFEAEEDGKAVVHAFLPIAETIGDNDFGKVLQMKSSGKAFPSYTFDHWELVSADPLQKGGKAEALMFQIRERKGLKVEQPDLMEYYDRL